MKTENEIRSRIQTLVKRELDFRIQESLKREPRYCVHYYKHFLDTRREISGEVNPYYNRIVRNDEGDLAHEVFGLCLYGSENPGEWSGNMCETTKDALECPHFEPVLNKAKIEVAYETLLTDLNRLEEELPQVFELLWVIDAVELPRKASWLDRLLGFFRARRPKQKNLGLLTIGATAEKFDEVSR